MENENMENRKITLSSRVEVAQEVVSCDLAGEAAILNMKDGVYYGLDPVGASIWNRIQKPALLVDVVTRYSMSTMWGRRNASLTSWSWWSSWWRRDWWKYWIELACTYS